MRFLELRFSQALTPLYGPLPIVGVIRLFTILDPELKASRSIGELVGRVGSPNMHIPLVCCVFSIATGFLSHEANRQYADKHKDAKASSYIAYLAYGSGIAILMMFAFATSADTVQLWFLSYSVLLIIGALWNFHAFTPESRTPHVVVNATLGLMLAVLALSGLDVNHPRAFYPLLVLLSVVKVWQRSRPRIFA